MSIFTKIKTAAAVLGFAAVFMLPAVTEAAKQNAEETRSWWKKEQKQERAAKTKTVTAVPLAFAAAAVPSYIELDYSKEVTVGGDAQTGKLSESVKFDDETVQAADLSFQAAAGKTYQITVKYEADTEIDMPYRFIVLTDGTLTGDYEEDVIVDINNYRGNNEDATEFTVEGYFISNKNAQFRILLVDRGYWGKDGDSKEFEEISYTITIKESDLLSYTTLSNSAKINVGDAQGVEGKLSGPVVYGGIKIAGSIYDFDTEEGKAYQITVNYKADTDAEFLAGFFIMHGGVLTGIVDDDVVGGGDGGDGRGELTVNSYFISPEDGLFRIFLVDVDGTLLDYTLTVREVDVVSYVDLDYSREIAVDGPAVEGKLSEVVLDWCDNIKPGAGLSFQAEEGESYTIVMKFAAETEVHMAARYHILTDEDLEGDKGSDVIDGNCEWVTAKEIAVSRQFTAPKDGLFKILLMNLNGNELNYSVNIVGSHTCVFSAEKIVVRAPTCDRDGRKAYVCSICGMEHDAEWMEQLEGAQCKTSILTSDRTIPTSPESKKGADVTVLQGEFTAGPNPVSKSSGAVKFFWQGKRVQNASLSIFDASGNVIVRSVKIVDKASDAQARREIGSWNLKDARGRNVTEGTYLVRGTITIDGKKERISVMIGVR